MLFEHPIVQLSNGLRVANFSSAHPFTFSDGTVLPGCALEMGKALELQKTEVPVVNSHGRWADVRLVFELSEPVATALAVLEARPDVDIVLVPLPVLEAIRETELDFPKARVMRAVDRVTRTVCIDKFCV